MRMAKIVAIVNQKGGVGKTTSCVNLAAALKAAGQRILLCDFDPRRPSDLRSQRFSPYTSPVTLRVL